jgi:hypothetical protein
VVKSYHEEIKLVFRIGRTMNSENYRYPDIKTSAFRPIETPILSVLLVFLPALAHSYTYLQDVKGSNPPWPSIQDAKYHNMNQVLLWINNTGQIGMNRSTYNDGVIWPIRTDNSYVYGSGLWIGAKADMDDDGDLDKVFIQGFDVLSAGSEVKPGRVGQDPEDPLARIFDSNDPIDLVEWPAEFRDPGSGEPIIFSEQDFVTNYNDVSGQPLYGLSNLGIEIRQRSMAFLHDLSANVIYFEWDLTNVSESMENGPYIFEDAWIGYDMDADLGSEYADDLTSFFRDMVTPEGDTIIIDAAIAWDSDFNEFTFTGTPGFMGLALIQGPGNPYDDIDNDGDGVVDESPFNGIDDDYDGNIDEPDEVDELGLINFSKHCNPVGTCEIHDPANDIEGYDLIACNTPESPTNCLENKDRGDIRFMISSGPFDWLPGQTIRIQFAFVFAEPVGIPTHLEFVGDPPRPDPNDPVLGNFITTVLEAREFARSGYTNVGIGKGGKTPSPTLPRSFALSQNYPNPFNPSTAINYSIPEGERVRVQLCIYDLRGRKVRTLVDEEKEAGGYKVYWDGRDDKGRETGSGVYFYKIVSGSFTSTKKMLMSQ